MRGLWIKKNWFLIGIISALFLGFLTPKIGINFSSAILSYFNKVLIIILFLLSGLNLPTETILKDLKDFRLHLYIQVFIFIITPLYFFLSSLIFKSLFTGDIGNLKGNSNSIMLVTESILYLASTIN